jgi:4-carboxymuconolactone decarboxylase
MTAEQKAIHDEIASTRTTGIRGPFGPWLANPKLAQPAQTLGRVCRYETTLDLRESELAILMTAQRHDCPTEWAIHVHEARRAGLEEPIIAALEAGRSPCEAGAIPRDGSDERIAAIHDFAEELLAKTRVGEERYEAARSALGERGVVELTSIIGYYTYVAMTLNVFEIEA